MKVIISLTAFFIFAYICVAGFIYVKQRDFLYFPTPEYEHPFDRVSVSSQGETIEVIVLNNGNSKGLIYFGGNGEAVVFNAEPFTAALSDVTIYLVNYRGYGGSSGEPTESGNYLDALAVYDQLKGSHSQISVAGRSLGSGVATYLAAKRPIDKIALITPYDSVLNVAKANFAIFPVSLLLKDRYDSLSRVKDIQSQALVVAAQYDQVIPMNHTQRLLKEFPADQVVYALIAEAGHNNLSGNPEFYKALGDFFSD